MLTEEQKRMHRVCFTGHRPEKLKQSESVIVKALETAIKEAIADGKNECIYFRHGSWSGYLGGRDRAAPSQRRTECKTDLCQPIRRL